ncbi:NB-ARC domains-containing protein, partial [Tanacetum coccineum]
AWILFKGVVGERVEIDADLKRVAKKVVKETNGHLVQWYGGKGAIAFWAGPNLVVWARYAFWARGHVATNCRSKKKKVVKESGGLPLFLKAVGNALKTKSIEDWDKALTRLKEHAPSPIDPDIARAFTHLKLSYDFLENEARSCFLLCIMFPEDERILLEDLVLYSVGLAKFHGLKSVDDARQRVEDAVKILTSSGLLLDLDDKRYTKMHDVVRDVALLISCEGKNHFLVEAGKGLTEWLPRHYELESYTGISLMKNKISKLPNYELHLPHLDIFLIQQNHELPEFSDELTRGMKEVKVLDMACCGSPPLPPSLKLLTKLRVLNLKGNKSLHDISILVEMKDLEVLIINETGIEEIPQEIGQLVNLRRLEAINCTNLYHVAPGVISNLWRLEELCIGFMYLRGGIHDYYPLFPEANLFSERHLVIKADRVEIPFMKWIKKVIEASPRTHLKNIKNLNNILPQLYHEGFSDLENMTLISCHNVSCLVDARDWDQVHTFHSSKHLGEGKIKEKLFWKLKHLNLSCLFSLEVLWNCPDQYISLSNLVTLEIHWCDKLVKVFSVNLAQGLVNLQSLSIRSSDSLKEVIWDGDEETDKGETEYIVFRSLARIFFGYMDRLESFYSGYSTIKYPSLVDVEIEGCPGMKIWGPGIHETPKLKFVGNVPLDGPDVTINDPVAKLYEAERIRKDAEVTRQQVLQQVRSRTELCGGRGGSRLPKLRDLLCSIETPKIEFVGNVPLDGPDVTINDVVAKIYQAEKKRQ